MNLTGSKIPSYNQVAFVVLCAAIVNRHQVVGLPTRIRETLCQELNMRHQIPGLLSAVLSDYSSASPMILFMTSPTRRTTSASFRRVPTSSRWLVAWKRVAVSTSFQRFQVCTLPTGRSGRGVIAALTRYANKGYLARAVLEATAFQSREVVEALKDSKISLESLRVDGGMVTNGYAINPARFWAA